LAFLDDLDAVRAPLRARIRSAMETDGPEAATEPWWRYVAGEDAWNKLAPDLRERMRASSETLFGIELGTYERYLPDDETLAAVAPRVRLFVSADGLPPYSEAARRFGQRLGRDVETTPGTHAAYHAHPIEFRAGYPAPAKTAHRDQGVAPRRRRRLFRCRPRATAHRIGRRLSRRQTPRDVISSTWLRAGRSSNLFVRRPISAGLRDVTANLDCSRRQLGGLTG
jgi:hypothetical protein